MEFDLKSWPHQIIIVNWLAFLFQEKKSKINFQDMESLFCQQAPAAPALSPQNSLGSDAEGKKKKDADVVRLIFLPILEKSLFLASFVE